MVDHYHSSVVFPRPKPDTKRECLISIRNQIGFEFAKKEGCQYQLPGIFFSKANVANTGENEQVVLTLSRAEWPSTCKKRQNITTINLKSFLIASNYR